ncbi:MAG: cytochrome C [Polaromonas sp.]|uniref:cytochrome C n=1 Tax=Polaromonas sp. TaxID=1869339 RepID=UPI0024892ED7|nr:cytochrome C [Polaromonas sp.]MDI1269512.1 cytochrome C [Polaromonas sp.]MDO9115721.1 cytochrome C [Polaromonas sp.]MDP1888713.1 cytochrome C [Polaromonas sp.]
MMSKKWLVALVIVLWGHAGPVVARTKTDALRGELLYSTHCIACHNAQLHWRDRKAARNWASLKAEVERWQTTTGLGWREEDVTDVARYLNALYYRFPEPQADAASTADASAPAPPR